MSQFEQYEGSIDKMSRLSKSGYKSEKKEDVQEEPASKQKLRRDYGGMYNTMPLQMEKPAIAANKALFFRSINQSKIDSLKNEKWPADLKTDVKEGKLSKSQNKSVSSFYIETMQIISKVNEHVKLIKENLMSKSGETDKEGAE